MKFIKSMQKPVSLKYHVHNEVARYEDARDHSIIHASDLTKDTEFCPREFALVDITKTKRKGMFMGTSMVVTFDTGDALADLLRFKWARNVAVGTWECLRCGKKYKFSKHPGKCQSPCGSSNFKYHEEVFVSKECGASGSKDLLVDLGEPLLRIVEIKTIDKDQFKVLDAPLAEHAWRTNLYMRLIADSDHPHASKINVEEGLVFYIGKCYGFKDSFISEHGLADTHFSPFKEFFVKRQDKLTDGIWEQSKELFRWRNKQGPMPSGVCSNGMCKRAQACPVCAECWSGTYPPGI